MTLEPAANPAARLLFRYIGGDEWNEYRAILAVFADTFFSDFDAGEVRERLDGRVLLAEEVVGDRLESLRKWGNLEASTDVGRPSSIDDYYRKRHRYLMTPAGQQVHNLVEGMLASADELADPQVGRMRELHRSLATLADHAPGDFADLATEDATELVRSVFDTHERFTAELTRFFRHLDQWQNRYDLGPDDVRRLAEVIVGYISERLDEVERMRRPIARSLAVIVPRLNGLLAKVDRGLAGRMTQAGLDDGFSVQRVRGIAIDDWRLLSIWFEDAPQRPSRLTQLTEKALAAVRTLTTNLSRLSRHGSGMSSRRGDFLRLAIFFDAASDQSRAHEIAAAALGLGSCRHAGFVSADVDDPAPTSTPWADAPAAAVPVSLRKRGERTVGGIITPIPDRSPQRRALSEQVKRERVEQSAAAAQLLAAADGEGRLDGAMLSASAFVLLRDLISAAAPRSVDANGTRSAHGTDLRCELRRDPARRTEVSCPHGRLTMHDVVVAVFAVAPTEAMGADSGACGGEPGLDARRAEAAA
ncbi:TIGR02677 family protein [Candidatus Poriferisodalis sp.]|uniref:TIGR02677 family protein n=1 Tax=Candidatus Poriferisodalis sp. TaxID=3101277 RepID=UPI003B025998